MCTICAELRPWTPECDYAALEPDLEPVEIATASGPSRSLSPSEIGAKLLTDYWNSSTPRSFDAEAGDTLTYDVSALTGAGRSLARAALEEWSAVTGLEFREVSGGFRPTAVRRESGDAAASTGTDARVRLGEAFDGRLGGGDRDWVRLDLPGGKLAEITVTGRGSNGLEAPGLTLYDARGGHIPLGVVYSGSTAEITVQTTGGGGTYYAQVSGLGGARGAYRLGVGEPGGRGGADIAFDDDRPGARAEFALEGSRIVAADVTISTGWLETHGTGRDSYGFQTYLHEIGHALGLGHPGDYGQQATFGRHAEYRNDSWQTSVMSYFSQRENPHVDADKAYAVTPMIGDIEAVRRLYGEARVREGDTVYGEGSNAGGMLGRVADYDSALAFTILDTGGTDRVNLASQRGDQRLDLRAGAVSDVLGHEGNMVIARGTVIEDATLGSGDDRVIGNGAGNAIRGGGGRDSISGGGGRDDIRGGTGDDSLRGQGGSDRIEGGSGRDRIAGGSGNDVLRGGDDADRIEGGSGRDRIAGGSGSDRLNGGSSDDALRGGGGADDLRGQSGDDVLRGGGGKDALRGQGGDDDLRGGGGRDVLRGQGGDDDLRGGGGDDVLRGGSGEDRMRGGGGDDRLIANGGGGRVQGNSGDDFLKGGRQGDRLDGGSGGDRIKGLGGSDRLEGGSGRDRIDGGGGRDRIEGERGNDVLKGGGGDDVFVFAGRFGRDTIRDFEARDAGEKIDLSDVRAIRSYDDLQRNHLRDRGDDAAIDAGGAGRIVLRDVSLDQLDASDFLF